MNAGTDMEQSWGKKNEKNCWNKEKPHHVGQRKWQIRKVPEIILSRNTYLKLLGETVKWWKRRTPAYTDGEHREASSCLHHHICSCIISLQGSVDGSWSSWQFLSFCVFMFWYALWSHCLPPPSFSPSYLAHHPGPYAWHLKFKSWEIKNNVFFL